MHIGNTIRKAHEKQGILFKTVAEQIGCQPDNYSHTLTQKGMTVRRFKEICDCLGLTMDQVYKIGEEDASN